MRQNNYFSVILLALLVVAFPTWATPKYVRVIKPFIKIVEAPTENAKLIYTTYQGIYFNVIDEKDNYIQINTLEGPMGWVHKDTVTEYESDTPPPPFKTGVVNPAMTFTTPIPTSSQSIDEVGISKDLSLPTASTVTVPESYSKKLFSLMKQDKPEYEYPELPKNFNLDINGFYETKLSMRDYSPKTVSDKRWDTIRNDPIFRKLPNDVLIGAPRLNIRYQIGIDGQINEKLSVHYDVQQEPDFPGLYDIKVKYDKSELTFHQLDAQFRNGEFINVNKSLNGVKATSYSDNWEAIVATGRQRSDPQKMETFGSGQKELRLQNRSILEGSIRLYFNNRRLNEGSDFTVNYYEGIIKFIAITPQTTDFIKIIYEFTNPIEDFIPALSRKNFSGAQFKWTHDSPDEVKLLSITKAEILWPRPMSPSANENPTEFDLAFQSIKPSSEKVLLNGRELTRNKHYVIKNQKGKLVLTSTDLSESDKLSIVYDYYKTTNHLETLIGNNSVGPYTLAKTQLLEGTEVVYANDILMKNSIDYDMDYVGGRIIFRYKIQYPTIISIDYQSIESTTILKDVKESPFTVGISYLSESVKSDEQTVLTTITQTNIPKPTTTNIITLINYPIVPSKDVIVMAGTTNIPVTIENAYKGQIRILGVAPPTSPTLSVTYSFIKSYSTNYTFSTLQGKNGAWYTEAELNLRDTPIKNNSISEIRLYGPINGIENAGNSFIRLVQNIDYVIKYDELSDNPGVQIQLKFLTQNDSGNFQSQLTQYPDEDNRATIFYEYTPQTTPDEGNIEQSMIGVTAGSKINKNWEVSAEIAAADHNFSKPRVATSSVFVGNGILNHNYVIGRQNLVENSETVTIEDGFISNILTKDKNYFINYRNGTIRFKDINPSKNHIIRTSYEFFTTGGTQAGQNSGYKLATKVATAYKSEKIEANANYKTIDKDFVPIGEIQEAKGTTILNGSIKFMPTQNESYRLDYLNQKTLKSSGLDENIYLNDEDIKAGARFSLFDTFDNAVSARLFTQVQDRKADEATHSIDNQTTEFDLSTHFGPNFFRNTLSYKMSNSQSDYLDKINLTETDINNFGYNSSIRFKKMKYLGNISLDPSLYLNTARTTDQQQRESIRTNTGYAASIWVIPNSLFKNQLQYSLDTIETETRVGTSNTKTANEVKNLLYDLKFDPTSWLNTHYQFNRKEEQSPISSQSGELNQTNLFEISRFSPKGLLLQYGMSQKNIISKTLNNSFFTYSTRINTIEKNNKTSSTEFDDTKISFNNFEPLLGIALKRTFYDATNSSGESIINSTTTSKNVNSRETAKYGGDVVVDSEWPILKHLTYVLSLEEYTEEREDRLVSNFATSNVVIEGNPISKRYQKLTLKPRHIRTNLNRWAGRDVGIFNLSIEEKLDRTIRSRTSTDYTNLITKAPVFTEDSSERHYITVNGDYTPFNLFRLTGTVTSGNEVYSRKNIASSASGTILKSILNGGVGLGFSPIKILDIDTSYQRNRVAQFKSPSINVGIDDIESQLGLPTTPLSASKLYSLEETVNARFTFKTFARIDLSIGGRSTSILELITTSNSIVNTITQTGALVGVKYRPFTSLSLAIDSEFRQTEQKNGSKGKSTSVTAVTKYDLFRSKNFNVKVEHTLSQTKGVDLNTLARNIQESGTGEIIQSQVSEQDYSTQTGSISANIVFPLTNSPYIDNFTITAEGHIKSIKDNIHEENSYDITGIILKGVLNF